MVPRRKVDVVCRVGATRRSHVLGIKSILERKRHAIQRHRLEIGIAPVCCIQFRRLLKGIWKTPKDFANCWRPFRQWPLRRVQIVVAFTHRGPLSPDIDGRQRIHLTGSRLADDHSKLLHHPGIGSGSFHSSKLQWRSNVPIQFRQQCLGLHGCLIKRNRPTTPDDAVMRWNFAALLGNQQTRWAVVRPDSGKVLLNHFHASRSAFLYGPMQIGYRRFFNTKCLMGFFRGQNKPPISIKK